MVMNVSGQIDNPAHSKRAGEPNSPADSGAYWSTVLATMTTQTIGADVVNDAVFRCLLLQYRLAIAISGALRQTAVRGRRRRCCARFRDADMLSPASLPRCCRQAT
jgi:hypothetical protein